MGITSRPYFPRNIDRQVRYHHHCPQIFLVCLTLAFKTAVRFQTLCVSDRYTQDTQNLHDRSATR